VELNNHTAAAGATVEHGAHAGLPDDLMARVAPCFARRETRLTCRDMVHGLLGELEDCNCWTLAEAAGHPSPCRMQHLLSRARCDEQQLLDLAAGWAAGHLTSGRDQNDVVLIVDETAGTKSSADCAGAARQYSGTLAHDRGIRAGFIAGDEVYGGLDLRRSIRERGTGYVMAVRSNHAVTLPSGRRLTVATASSLVKPAMWQRMRTGSAAKGAKDHHWAMTGIIPDDTPEARMTATASCCSAGTATPALSATSCAGPRPRSRWPGSSR